MKIRILFYRAERDGHPLDDAINIYTAIFNFPKPRLNLKKWWQEIKNWWRRCYSHVELWVPDEVHGFELINKAIGYCYTSTMRGDAKGVCKRPASEVLKFPGRWDVCEIEVRGGYTGMIKVAEDWVINNEGYDFKAIASFFWPWRIHDAKKWICSEFVSYLLSWVLLKQSHWPWNTCPSPRRLSRWLTKRGYKITPLLS